MKKLEEMQSEPLTLSTKDLFVNRKAQRELQKWKVDKIVREFNPRLVNRIKVSFRDGKYWVFDGQHTMEALIKINGGKDCLVRCEVFYGLTEEDEAELFIQQNGASTKVSVLDKMRVKSNYGGEDEINLARDSNLAGVRVDFTSGKALNKITAVNTLMKCYKSMTREQYISMIRTIRDAWQGIPESFCKEILLGMTRFYLVYGGKFKDKDLALSLRNVSPVAIAREGRGRLGISDGTAYARVILGIYNNKRRSGRLDENLL